MSKNLFITGTGTDVGKTYITALIVKKLKEGGKHSAYYKAAMSGNQRSSDGSLIPGDAVYVKTQSGIEQSVESMCPYVYEHGVSPHLASKMEGNPVELSVIEKTFLEISRQYEYTTVEGSGGIVCPIRYDDKKICLDDIVKHLQLPSVIVADAGLGTINHAVLTASYMRTNGMTVKGIILNNFHHGDCMEEDNKLMCEYMTGLKVLACVCKGDTSLDINADDLAALYE